MSLFSRTSAIAHAAHRPTRQSEAAFVVGGKDIMDIAELSGSGGHKWRLLGWGTAVALLSAPFVAMQLHAEGVDWSVGDFLVMGVMLGTVGGLIELAMRTRRSWPYRGGVVLALLGAFLLTWANLAVGIVGSEHNPNNLLFFIALLMGIAGAVGGNFSAGGMKRAMITTVITLILAFVIAELGQHDEPMAPPLAEGIGTFIFVLLFAGSALLFRRAERQSDG
jgi:hypothetical protein